MTDHRSLPRHMRARHALEVSKTRVAELERENEWLRAEMQRIKDAGARTDAVAGLTRALEIVRDLDRRRVPTTAAVVIERELNAELDRVEGA